MGHFNEKVTSQLNNLLDRLNGEFKRDMLEPIPTYCKDEWAVTTWKSIRYHIKNKQYMNARRLFETNLNEEGKKLITTVCLTVCDKKTVAESFNVDWFDQEIQFNMSNVMAWAVPGIKI